MKDVGSKPFVTNGTIVTFDISVRLRLPRLDIAERYVVFAGPLNELAADIFVTITKRIIVGFPRRAIAWSRLRMTRAAGNENSTSMPNLRD